MSIMPILSHPDVTLVTEPAKEPVTVDELRDDHLRLINVTIEANKITLLIRAARQLAEGTSRRALITQDWELWLDAFPCRDDQVIEVPFPPCQQIVSITYIDLTGTEQTWPTTEYQTRLPKGPYAQKATILPAVNTSWPSTQDGVLTAVKVQFRAGYGDDGTTVPQLIRSGILQVAAEMYTQRTESVHDVFQHPAVMQARRMFAFYKAA